MSALPQITEKAFQQQVLDYAALRGWRTYHTHDSRRSAPGLPDLVLVRPADPRRGYEAECIFAELKTESGRPSAHQVSWLQALDSVAGIRAYLWRPSDWPEVEAVLR